MDARLEKLTIGIPVYNDARYIKAAVESCVAQAGLVTIYDNCSTDGSSEICAGLARQHANVRHIRHESNVGGFENFRRIIFGCQTEYIALVGSHDLIPEGYALTLLARLEGDPAGVLAAGQIVHIDEEGEETGFVTRIEWAGATRDKSAVIRAGECAVKLRKDCMIYYGLYRTAQAQAAWFDTPSLGFDRAMVVRAAALGNILYVPETVFYARNLDKSRDAKKDRDRRVFEVSRDPGKALPKNVFDRNMSMVRTVLDAAKTPDELTLALQYIDKINRKYQNRRYYQKRRLVKIIGGVLVALLAGLGFAYRAKFCG